MVSLKQRQALAEQAQADPHLSQFRAFLAGDRPSVDAPHSGAVREEILAAVALDDAARFKKAATEIGQRRISPDSDWCQDDYLVFLLLVGNEKFGRPLNFLSRVIDARRANPNPIPRKINEV